MNKYISEILSTLNELKNVVNVVFLNKGYSRERKFILTTNEGLKYILRLSFPKNPMSKIMEMERMLECKRLGVKCSEPIRYGLTSNEECFYALLSWIDGDDGATIINELPKKTHQNIGYLAGKDLKIINSIPDTFNSQSWFNRYKKKQNLYYDIFVQSDIDFSYKEIILSYIKENFHIIQDRPSYFLHDDFHLNNIILNNKTYAGIIDFNRCDFGDPWHEFIKLYMFSSEISKEFCIGQINGYFSEEKIPDNFFKITALYTAVSLISALVWSKRLVPHKYQQMKKRVERIINDFDKFNLNKPEWLII